MKFLIDAQLPRRMVRLLKQFGHDAVHTLDLPRANRTTDAEINERSMRENFVVITKDADFVSSFVLAGIPYKLLIVSTGNISNSAIEELFRSNLRAIAAALDTCRYRELTRIALIIHE